MIDRTSGTVARLAVSMVLVTSCTSGGVGNDFGVGPSDDAPTGVGAPADVNEPPSNDDAPFGSGAPSDPNGVPGDPPLQPAECRRLCQALYSAGCLDDWLECERACLVLPPVCSRQLVEVAECLASVGCGGSIVLEQLPPGGLDGCRGDLDAYARCVGEVDDDLDPPGGGDGGQGGI